MLLRATVVALVAVLSPISIGPTAGAIPDEPGAVVLPDARILQAVAADLDVDGSRELVRLVLDDSGVPSAEAYGLGADGWAMVGEPVQLLPDIADVPIRLLVHRVAGAERVVVASQPRLDDGTRPPCCLLLHELLLDGNELRLVPVAEPTGSVDGILAIDLDGDRTDELLTARSLPPLGGISFPTEARVYRWTDGGFGAPTQTELPIGSGDTPFIIGDSDGRPGDEAAFISTLGPPGLYRIVLGPDDTLTIDEFGRIASDARGVPLGDSVGIAVVRGSELAIMHWPAFGAPRLELARLSVGEPDILGVVDIGGVPHLVVQSGAGTALEVLALPDLDLTGGLLRSGTAAIVLGGLPMRPYTGLLPGGGPDGRETVVFGGRLIPLPGSDAPPVPFAAASATLLGARPVGLVGHRDWMAILHVPHVSSALVPSGGRLEILPPLPDAWVSIAPLPIVLTEETDAGVITPRIHQATALDGRNLIAIGAGGFTVDVQAPPGSRVHWTYFDPLVVTFPGAVPSSGELAVRLVPPEDSHARYRAALIIVTPAGHGYVARWDIQLLTEPPSLDVRATTTFGSGDVVISGRTASDASVLVGGDPVLVDQEGGFEARAALPPWPTDVEVVATDLVGNTARTVVSGVGIFDYRGLPWIPIVAALVAVAGVALYLRQPRPAADPRPRDGDGALEELEAD